MTDREQVAAYVLDEMNAAEREDFERRLEHEPALRDEVEATRLLSAGLESLPADAWPADPGAAAPEMPAEPAPVPPPILPQAAMPARKPPRRPFARPAFVLTAVVAALAIGVLAGDLIGNSGGSGGGGKTTAAGAAFDLKPLGDESAAGAVVHVGADRTVELDAHDLPDSGRDHYYELWLMTDASRTVPVASFAVGGDGVAKVRVPLPADPSQYRYYDISRQRVDGGTDHSAESVLRGSTG